MYSTRHIVFYVTMVLTSYAGTGLAEGELVEVAQLDRLLAKTVAARTVEESEDRLRRAKQQFAILMNAKLPAALRDAVVGREGILVTVGTVKQRDIQGDRELNLVELTMAQISDLQKLKVLEDPGDPRSAYVTAGDRNALKDIYNYFWHKLERFADRTKAEVTRITPLERNEFIISQLAGWTEGKLTIMELIGDSNTKQYQWKEVKSRKLQSKILLTSGPLRFDLSAVKSRFVVVVGGRDLLKVVKRNERWIRALALSVPIVIAEENGGRVGELKQLFCGQENVFVMRSHSESNRVRVIDVTLLAEIGHWPVQNLLKGSNLANLVNKIINAG